MNELEKLNKEAKEKKEKAKQELQLEFIKLVNEHKLNNTEIAERLWIAKQTVSKIKNNINYSVTIEKLQSYIDKI